MSKSTISTLKSTEETLYTAKLGLKNFIGATNPKERMASLRNLVVFGRSVTFVLQNLRSIEPEFDSWYEPFVNEMNSNPLMKFFVDLRNKILKTGELKIHHVTSFSGNPFGLIERSKPAPPNARSFIIQDEIGGCGWEVELLGGSTEMYYVEVPADIPNFNLSITTYFLGVPEQFDDVSIEQLCEKYILYLEKLVNEAKQRFQP